MWTQSSPAPSSRWRFSKYGCHVSGFKPDSPVFDFSFWETDWEKTRPINVDVSKCCYYYHDLSCAWVLKPPLSRRVCHKERERVCLTELCFRPYNSEELSTHFAKYHQPLQLWACCTVRALWCFSVFPLAGMTPNSVGLCPASVFLSSPFLLL